MATKQSYHQFDPSDMPEIRQLRSAVLRSLRLSSKLERLDKIANAIVPDIDWDKLSIDRDDLRYSTKMGKLDNRIRDFRDEVTEKLCEIILEISDDVLDEAKDSASDDRLYSAACDMAHNYHARSKKSRSRRKKYVKNSTDAQTSPMRPVIPPAKTTETSRKGSTTSSSKSGQKLRPTSAPKMKTTSRPGSRTATNRTNDTNQGRPITSSSGARDNKNSRTKSARQNPQANIHHQDTPRTSQTTLKTHYKTTKSTKILSPPPLTLADFVSKKPLPLSKT